MPDVLSKYVNLSRWNKHSLIIHLSRRAVSISITVSKNIWTCLGWLSKGATRLVPLLPWTLVEVFLHIDSIDVYYRVWRETLSWGFWAFKGSWWFKGCDDQGCSFFMHNPVSWKSHSILPCDAHEKVVLSVLGNSTTHRIKSETNSTRRIDNPNWIRRWNEQRKTSQSWSHEGFHHLSQC